jgi:hypothetical protein
MVRSVAGTGFAIAHAQIPGVEVVAADTLDRE